ncbi:type II toxin-antitoxin system RelE/ParE family toxin [soil metagenome]
MSCAIVWSESAMDQVESIHEYLLEVAPSYADKVVLDIIKTVNSTLNFPKIGPVEFTLNGTIEFRYLISRNWKILYSIKGIEIVIASVFDTRQNPLKMWKGLTD